MPFLTAADGAKLYTKDWGSGPPVVLIHGWPLDADMWEAQALALAEAGFRVISYDRRGFGRSEQTWTGYTYDTLADDLKAVIDGLSLEDVSLVGFSMGGGEVARYMSRTGGAKVAKAVLVSAVTPFMLKTGDNPEGVDKSVFDGIVAGLRKDRAHFLADFLPKVFGVGLLSSPVSSKFMRWMLEIAMLASPKATLDCAIAFSETDFRSDMAAFTVPTLVIHGDADQTVPLDVAGRRAAAMIPDAELTIYEGAPHGIPATHADRLNADLLAFLRG